MVLVLASFWAIAAESGPVEENGAADYQHSIIVDSGSTGSRVYLYRYRESDPFSSLESINRIRVRPALSSFTNNTAGLSAQLDKFVEFAHEMIPLDEWKRTSFTLRATAGIRKLAEEERGALMTQVKSLLTSKLSGSSDFTFDHARTGVIPGEMEALYDMSAVMVSVRGSGSSNSSSSEPSESSKYEKRYGSLDLGGSSMQYAYSESSVGEYLSSLHPFLISFSGMGLIDSMEDSLSRVLNREGAPDHPCVPSGGIPSEGREGFEEADTIPGAGDFAACVSLIKETMLPRMLEEAGLCRAEREVAIGAETFAAAEDGSQGGFVPDIVVGLDNVPSLLFMLGLHSRRVDGGAIEKVEEVPLVSPAEIAVEGERICGLSWQELIEQVDPSSSFNLPSYRGHRACFGASLLVVTLQEVVLRGCGRSEPGTQAAAYSSEGILMPLDEVKNVGELSWALGAALLDALEVP